MEFTYGQAANIGDVYIVHHTDNKYIVVVHGTDQTQVFDNPEGAIEYALSLNSKTI